jgi:hypothetical protein
LRYLGRDRIRGNEQLILRELRALHGNAGFAEDRRRKRQRKETGRVEAELTGIRRVSGERRHLQAGGCAPTGAQQRGRHALRQTAWILGAEIGHGYPILTETQGLSIDWTIGSMSEPEK